MKKTAGILLALILGVATFAGCSSDTANAGDSNPADTNTTAPTDTVGNAPADNTAAGSAITVVRREEGSGTHGAFIELFGIETKNDDGDKIDQTTVEANVSNSTSVMMATVAGDPGAVGYVSLGSLNDTVKAVDIDGVPATVDNIKNGSYSVSRPFNVATGADLSDVARDFIDFILSEDGQAVVEDNGYISTGNQGAYTAAGASGTVVVAGSSSVTPVMEKLKEAYTALNPDIEIEIQQSDSSTGMTSTIEGICDIGMASRELKDSELEAGLAPTVIAMDGIAVVVNNENPVDALATEDVYQIFTGEKTTW